MHSQEQLLIDKLVPLYENVFHDSFCFYSFATFFLGELKTKTRQQAQYLKDDGIVIFALGIGSGIKMTELKAMVSMEPYVFLFSSVRQMVPSDKASDIALALCAGQSPLHVPRPSFLLVKICVVFSFFLLNKSNLPPN